MSEEDIAFGIELMKEARGIAQKMLDWQKKHPETVHSYDNFLGASCSLEVYVQKVFYDTKDEHVITEEDKKLVEPCLYMLHLGNNELKFNVYLNPTFKQPYVELHVPKKGGKSSDEEIIKLDDRPDVDDLHQNFDWR